MMHRYFKILQSRLPASNESGRSKRRISTIFSSILFIAVFGAYASAQIFYSANEAFSPFRETNLLKIGDKSSTDQFTELSQYSQGFEVNNVWGDPPTDPTRVASGTNGITSKTGGFHAEAVAGNFTRWGGYNSVFPASGYTTSIDIYLDVSGAYANDTRFDYTSAINQPDGNHRRDFVFNAGFYNDGVAPGAGNRFVVGASNNSGQPPKNPGGDPYVVTASGWYTFKHRFFNNGSGRLAVQMSLLNASGTVLKTWVRSDPSDVIGSTVGGNRYGWFPTNDFPFLAIDNSVRANVVQDAPVQVQAANPNGWTFDVSGATAAGAFSVPPAGQPLGRGSYRSTIGANGDDFTRAHNGNFSGTRLDQLTSLSYSTYVTAHSDSQAHYLSLKLDLDGDNIVDDVIYFEPVYQSATYFPSNPQAALAVGTWQTWNALAGGWWSTNGIAGANPGDQVKSIAQYLAAQPNARIMNDATGGLRVIAGGGAPDWNNFDGSFDNLKIGVLGNETTFDFDPPTITTVVDDDGMASATDCNATDAASTTLADAYSVANPGDTIRVCPGTYVLPATVNINKANLTITGVGPTKPVIQAAQAIGNAFHVISNGVTLNNLEIQKTDAAGPQDLVWVQGNNFTATNNLIYGPNPGGTWNSTGIVSRALLFSPGANNATISNNTIHTLRQPAYVDAATGGVISNNNVSGTKGWVVAAGIYNFTGNTFGEPQNQDCDIALLSLVNPADYPTRLAMSTANDNAFICAQYAGGENGRAVAYVDDNAGLGGNGSDNANYQSINAGIAGALAGGTVQVAAGGYNEDVTVTKSVIVSGAGASSTTVTGPIGGSGSTIAVAANNVEIRGFKITRAGNNVTDWNNPGLKVIGVSVQGTGITGMNLHDNLITGNRNGVDINNSNGHTIRNNVITDNRTGLIFRNQTDNLTFVENEVTNNWTVGVLFLDASGGSNSPVQTAANGTFFNNNISGNWYGQIVDRQTGGSLPAPGTNLKNFGGNWLGTSAPVVTTANSAEPGYAAQIPVAFGGTATPPGGQPDIAGPASANIDFSPFLGIGTDTNVQTTPLRGTYGFQGAFNNLNVSAASPQANGSLSNIQEGINLVTAGGTLNILNGTYAGNVDVNKVLTLKGTPTILGTLTTSVAGARISPGFSPGIINSGSLSMTSGSSLDIELNGTTAGTGYDQVNVTGTVSLGGATLNVTTGFAPTAGNTFTIINNDGADPVSGTFDALPEGTVFYVGANSFRISYVGGTGNDVVLTAVSLCNTVSIPSGIPTPTGVPVTVPVNVDDVTGNGLLSFDMRLAYNPAVINSPSVSLTALTSGSALTVNTATPGVLIVSVYNSQPFAGSGALLNITFNAVGSIGSSSGVNFTSFVFNEGSPCLSTSNGSVNIVSGSVSGTVTYANSLSNPPVVRTTLTGTGSVPVSTQTDLSGAYTLSGFGSGAYTVTPSKTGDVNGITSNDSAIIAQYVAGLTTLNPTQLIAADVSGSNTVTSFDAALIARYVVLLPNSGSTGTWRFTPTSRSYPSGIATNQTGQDYSAILMGEVTGTWAAPSSFAPLREELRPEDRVAVRLPKLDAATGDSLTIPVEVGDLSGKGVVSYQFDLVYNPKVLEPEANPVDKAQTLSDGLSVTYNVSEDGRLKVAVFGVQPLVSKGVLLNLRFKVTGGGKAVSPLNIENFVFNESDQLAAPVNGELQISKSAADTITVEGQLLTSTGTAAGDAEVVLTDTRGASRSVRADETGYFRFKDLTAGESYVISVNSKRYNFTPQTVSPAEGVMKLNLIAEP
ncbi:MAG: right-handed parallel beta-helix repeat-containing protein [Acidobacteria bacterium]|nr:right-handed parallel beta-helix repeat-containing protein [Acidobacteriota bacterium]